MISRLAATARAAALLATVAIAPSLAVAAPPIALVATLDPRHAPPLLPVVVSVSVINRTQNPVVVVFPTPDLFAIQIRDAQGTVVYDSQTGHQPIAVKREMHFAAGVNRLATFQWDALGDARRALQAPGSYVVHVEMTTTDGSISSDLPLVIDAPATIAAVLAGTPLAQATIVGIPERNGNTMYLRDDSGTIALSHPLGINPRGRFFVRGYVQRNATGQSFVIDRFVPAAENLDSQGTPIPRVTATPK